MRSSRRIVFGFADIRDLGIRVSRCTFIVGATTARDGDWYSAFCGGTWRMACKYDF